MTPDLSWITTLPPALAARAGALARHVDLEGAPGAAIQEDLSAIAAEAGLPRPALDCLLAAEARAPEAMRRERILRGQFELGLHDDLIATARAAIAAHGPDPMSLYWLALALARMGAEPQARATLIAAISLEDGLGQTAIALDDPVITRVAFDAIAAGHPRIAEILRPCALLGRAEPHLSPRNEALIAALLARHREDFEAGRLAQPADLARAATPGPRTGPHPSRRSPGEAARILIVAAQYIECNPAMIDHDATLHMVESARAAGYRVDVFYGDQILYNPPLRTHDHPLFLARLAELDALIAEDPPDLIVLETNFVPSPISLQGRDLDRWRSAGVPVVGIFYDSYDIQEDFLGAWAPHLDWAIVLTLHSSRPALSSLHDRILYWPDLPFAEHLFHPDEIKHPTFTFIGSRTRGRHYFVSFAERFGVHSTLLLHDRSRARALSMPDFLRVLGRSLMVFNTGQVLHGQFIVTGRAFETILSQALLIEESGGDLDRLLLPFIHYIPVANAHQTVHFAQYFLKHPDEAARIARAGHDWVRRHFPSGPRWDHLVALALDPPPRG